MSETFAYKRGALRKSELYSCQKYCGPDHIIILDTIVLCGPSTPFTYKVQGEQGELQTTSPSLLPPAYMSSEAPQQSHLSSVPPCHGESG